jgi:bifunctional DNase/RNase
VGAVEASAIAFAQQGLSPTRPLTHDLFTTVLQTLGAEVERVEITDLIDGVFYAELHLAGGKMISARPSDAVALALRATAPISVSEALFSKIPDQSEDEVEKFREFLDQINPEDFAS